MSATATVKRLLAAADAARARGDIGAIMTALEDVIAALPDHAASLNTLGVLYQRQGHRAHALAMFVRATEADPGAPALWLNRAAAHGLAGDDAGEAAALAGALAADPYFVPALLQRARLEERGGAIRAAARSYAAALDITGTTTGLPPAMVTALAHGRSVVAAHKAALAISVAAHIGDRRRTVPDADAARFDACVAGVTGTPVPKLAGVAYPSTPTGLDYPGLPLHEFFPRAALPWLPRLEAGTADAQREFAALVDSAAAGFVPYVDYAPGMPVNQWAALNGSPDWSAFFLWKDGVRQDDNCARCPATTALVESLPNLDLAGRGPTAFFSVLRPGAVIPPHVGATNIRTIVHLALIVPPGCGFRVGSETRQWVEGTAFAFDDTIEHEAWNPSDRLRAVLIMDIWNPELTSIERDLLRDLTRGMDAHAAAA